MTGQMMSKVLELESFDDFFEIAQGCNQVFYMIEDVPEGTVVKAYAGRVAWQGTLPRKPGSKSSLEKLKELRAKKVKSYVDLEWWFR